MPSPKWIDPTKADVHRERTHAFGRMQEKAVTKTLRKGRAVAGSGQGRTKGDARALVERKADAREVELHVEVKATTKDSFSVSRTILDKLTKDAGYSRLPVLVVRLVGQGKRTKTMVCLPLAAFKELTGQPLELGDE